MQWIRILPAVSRSGTAKPRGLLMVELALILPLIFLLLWGMAELSVAIYNKTIVTYASRDAVRTGVLARTPRMSEAEIEDMARKYLQESLLFYSTLGTTVDIVRPDVIGAEDRLRVTIRHEYPGLGLGRFMPGFSGPMVVSSSAVMRYE
jgi:Flp pilus assembly protein TadG